MTPRTLFDKIWDAHVVAAEPGEPSLLYVDLHLVHEVTSPQAFESLRIEGRTVRRPGLVVATMDHNVPTDGDGVSGADADEHGPDGGAASELRCSFGSRASAPAIAGRASFT